MDNMEDIRKDQVEALQVALPYCEKIVRAIGNVCKELTEERQDDTDEYIDSILKGLNWIIEVYNGTRDLINADRKSIDEDEINKSVQALNAAYNNKDDAGMVATFEILKAFVMKFIEVSKQYI